MNMGTYRPVVTDEKTTEIPAWMERHIDEIAEMLHDNWAARRFEQGWKWGEQRDAAQNIAPCLTHYRFLPGDEKEHCRQRAREALAVILSVMPECGDVWENGE